tara:strand:- start:4499 stop:4990 length:492 start_codon:yes stop_codon:yes gene_type:complete
MTLKCLSGNDLAKLGNGTFHGISTETSIGSSDRATTRFILRNAFGNSCLFKNYGLTKSVITPFRMVMNAGDPNGTKNSAPTNKMPGSNQVNGIQGALSRANMTFGGARNDGNSYFSGNPTYVYDSSNYVTFKRQQAVNRNYNDLKNGGDQHNASYVNLMAVRR